MGSPPGREPSQDCCSARGTLPAERTLPWRRHRQADPVGQGHQLVWSTRMDSLEPKLLSVIRGIEVLLLWVNSNAEMRFEKSR